MSKNRKKSKHSASNGRSKPDLKIVIVGDADVGKTCLLRRYVDKKFVNSSSTIGAAFIFHQWDNHNVAIWDTAGEERYSGLGSFYFRSAGAAILAFDVSNEESFHALRNRFVPLLEHTQVGCLNVVVGTKLDLVKGEKRKIPSSTGRMLAASLNPDLPSSVSAYFETSSLTGENVERTFEFIFQTIFSLKRCLPAVATPNNVAFSSENVDLLQALPVSNGLMAKEKTLLSCCGN